MVLVFEDLHWIDGESQALLNLLADSIGTARILMLVNYRPEYRHEWGNKSYYTQLRLDPLGTDSAEEMLSAVLGEGKDLVALKRFIVRKTDGNPFFMEEMVRALFEQGVLSATERSGLPSRSVISGCRPRYRDARRAHRPVAAARKGLAADGGGYWRGVSTRRGQRVTGTPRLTWRLAYQLATGEFIYEKPAVADVQYTFKHALTQDVAYNSVLIERRRLIHERAAPGDRGALCRGAGATIWPNWRITYDRSGNVRKAVEYLKWAGEQACRGSAYDEALGSAQAEQSSLLAQMPESRERDEGA